MVKKFALLMVLGLLLVFATTSVVAAPAEIPNSGQTTVYSAGDAGSYQTGVVLPNPRFTNPDKTTPISGTVVVDQLTGLMWPQHGGTPTVGLCTGGTMTWQAALNYVACLNAGVYLGYSDWRLPDVNELESLENAGQPSVLTWLIAQGFTNVRSERYWSSSTLADYPVYAWHVHFLDVFVTALSKTSNFYVWPVRSGLNGAISLPKTGQTTVYSTGDNGSQQEGVAWPSPRFTNTDGTVPVSNSVVVDQLTGLVWPQEGGTPTVGSCTGGSTTWQGALDYVACLNTANYLGYNDWRLPDRKELRSPADYGQSNVAVWLNTQGFAHMLADNYWSSSTYAGSTSVAWFINMYDGHVDAWTKVNHYYVWPVRGGQSGSFAYLTISKYGAGSGKIILDRGALIWSGSTGTASYGTANDAMTVNMTAVPDSGSVFAGWSGDADCSDGTIVMSTSKNCMATFTSDTPAPASGATLAPDMASPQFIGNHAITFTAGGIGGSGDYEYKFWLKTAGVWNTVQDYSTTNTWTWNTTGAAAATYGVQVYVRNVGSSAKYEATKTMSYTLNPSPATGATLISNKPSPQTAGSNVTFTAGGVGGSGNYEYRFWIKAAGVWTTVQGYSATNTFNWDTTGLPPGTYRAQVYVRNAGSTAKYEAVLGMGYVIK